MRIISVTDGRSGGNRNQRPDGGGRRHSVTDGRSGGNRNSSQHLHRRSESVTDGRSGGNRNATLLWRQGVGSRLRGNDVGVGSRGDGAHRAPSIALARRLDSGLRRNDGTRERERGYDEDGRNDDQRAQARRSCRRGAFAPRLPHPRAPRHSRASGNLPLPTNLRHPLTVIPA